MENNELLILTEKLQMLTNTFFEQFQTTKTTGERGDFYKTVKPFADEVKVLNDKWKLLALKWVEETKPKYIHPLQIENCYEQIETLSIQAFYPETSKSRFLHYLQTVRYILTTILDELSNEKIKK